MAANIDEAISSRGWTNRQTAEAIGATEHQVWRWRRARHMPSLDTLARLADVLFDGDMGAFYTEPERSAA